MAASIRPNHASVVANLQWWFKADTGLSAYNDGDNATNWVLEGSGQHAATQFTGGTVANKREGTGPGGTDWVEAAQDAWRSSNGGTLTMAGGITAFVVARTGDNSHGAQTVNGNDAISGASVDAWAHAGSNPSGGDVVGITENETGQALSDALFGGVTSTNTWVINVARREDSGGTWSAFHATDSSALADVTKATPVVEADPMAWDTVWKRGNAEASEGVGIAEFIVYDRKLTNNEVNLIYNYMAQKYGFPEASASGLGGGGSKLVVNILAQ